MEKIFLIISLGTLIVGPLIALAQPLVPCDITTGNPCQFCHIFVLFRNILDFLFFRIVPPLAILMVATAGMYFIFAGGQVSNIEKAKSILQGTVISLLIIYGAWLVVNLFFMVIGVADWTGLKEGWFKIDCPII
jgi:hypothetical protein